MHSNSLSLRHPTSDDTLLYSDGWLPYPVYDVIPLYIPSIERKHETNNTNKTIR